MEIPLVSIKNSYFESNDEPYHANTYNLFLNNQFVGTELADMTGVVQVVVITCK